MMAELDVPASPAAIAAHYGGLLDGMVIDQLDGNQAETIRASGLSVLVADTMMVNLQLKQSLATQTLAFALSLSGSND